MISLRAFTQPISALTLSAGLFLAASATAKDVRPLNLKDSHVGWVGRKIIGSQHNGKLMFRSGEVVFEGANPQSARVVVDMTSITCEDIKSAKDNRKLVSHLKNDDFFSVNKFPDAVLEVKSFKKRKDGAYDATGTLTIKGIAKSTEFVAKPVAGQAEVYNADLTFDRTLYNVRYGSNKFFDNLGDKVIDDKVSLSARISLQGKATRGKS